MAYIASVGKVAEHFHTGFDVLEAAVIHDHVVAGPHMLTAQHRPDHVQQPQDRATQVRA